MSEGRPRIPITGPAYEQILACAHTRSLHIDRQDLGSVGLVLIKNQRRAR